MSTHVRAGVHPTNRTPTRARPVALLLVFLACGDAPESPVGSTESAVMNSLAWTSEVGRIGGAHSVGDDGQFRYSMAVDLPSGRAGFTPDVRLTYASDNSVGVVGVGFQLDAGSAITRCGRTVAIDGFVAGPRYDDSDVFCLDGARLVPETAGSSVYRTASESHLRAEAHYGAAASDGPEWWSVEFPDGTVGRFGADGSGVSDLRPAMEGTNTVAYWLEGEREDQFGNQIELGWDPPHYPPGSTTALPRSLLRTIRYGGHANGHPHRYEIRMGYATAHPTQSGYQAGHAWELRGTLDSIRVHAFGDPSPFATYRLTYSTEGATGNPRLTHLQRCAKAPGNSDPADPPGNVCQRPTEFRWEHGEPDGPVFERHSQFWETQIDRAVIPRSYRGPIVVEGLSEVMPLDFDGDRVDDLLYIAEGQVRVRLGHPDSSHALTEVVETSIGWEPTLSRGRQFMVRDHNGDGRDDLLIVTGADTDDDGHSDEARVTWLKSTGNDFEVIDIGRIGPITDPVLWTDPGPHEHLHHYLPSPTGERLVYAAEDPGYDPTDYFQGSHSFANDFNGMG